MGAAVCQPPIGLGDREKVRYLEATPLAAFALFGVEVGLHGGVLAAVASGLGYERSLESAESLADAAVYLLKVEVGDASLHLDLELGVEPSDAKSLAHSVAVASYELPSLLHD